MTIENKTLYKLWQSVKDIAMDNFGYGIYIEGFEGGAAVYAAGGKAACRKTVYSDNRRNFVHYLDNRLFMPNLVILD